MKNARERIGRSAGALCLALSILLLCSCEQRKKFEILCDGQGHYSFVNWDGLTYPHVFASREDAVKAAAKEKHWSDDYDAHRREAEAVKWKRCPLNGP
jgi:hypothetical protein